MADPERLTYGPFDLPRPLTALELDEVCQLCAEPRRKHQLPRYSCPVPPHGTFEPSGEYGVVPPKLAQSRALTAAELAGWRPVWEPVRDEAGKQVGWRITNEAEMFRIANKEAKRG